MAFRDELEISFNDDEFVTIFQELGETSPSSLRLALVTILQFRENLSDNPAAEAIRSRTTWKYLLGLELIDPGFEFSVLGEYRGRLDQRSEERYLLDCLVERSRPFGLLPAPGESPKLGLCLRDSSLTLTTPSRRKA